MKTSLYSLILRLVSYGLNTGLIEKEDTIYTINQLLDLYKMDEPDDKGSQDGIGGGGGHGLCAGGN